MIKADDPTATKLESKSEEAPPYERPSHCLLCGLVGPALVYGHWICAHCANVVRAEALARRRRVVIEGGGPPGQ